MTFENSETAAKALSASPDDLVLDNRTLRLAAADTTKKGESGGSCRDISQWEGFRVGGVPSGRGSQWEGFPVERFPVGGVHVGSLLVM